MKKKQKKINKAASLMGKLGGPARAKALSPERRREIAIKAINARWDKYRKEAELK